MAKVVKGAVPTGRTGWGQSLVDDLTELRAQFVALLEKLDADTGTTDDDYETELTPAALTTTK